MEGSILCYSEALRKFSKALGDPKPSCPVPGVQHPPGIGFLSLGRGWQQP